MRPFCLIKSRSQDAAENASVLSVYLTNPYLYKTACSLIENKLPVHPPTCVT